MNEIPPERKLAQLFAARKGFSPPVDVHALCAELADVEEDATPDGVDAVVLHPSKTRTRHAIILNEDLTFSRKRFTLAHELGHILIPWHLGTMSCHTEVYYHMGSLMYRHSEAEANRFASELILPSTWLAKQVARVKDPNPEKIIDRIATLAEVSVYAASLSVKEFLSPGYIIVVTDASNVVVSAYATQGALMPLPDPGNSFDSSAYEGLATSSGHFGNPYNTIHWFHFDRHAVPFPTISDARDPKEILKKLAESYLTPDRAKRAIQQFSGIFGALDSQFSPKSKEEFYALVKQRLVGREEELVQIIQDPEFEIYLVKKIEGIMRRRGS